jgi:hypothetical protein
MPIIAKAGTSFTPAPAGTHTAVCVDVVDDGMIEVTYQGRTERKHMITIFWQIDENMDDGKPFLVRRRYNCSLHEKATLRRDLESWRGRSFADKELQAFDLEKLLSAGCLINVIHEQRNGSTYANVASVMRLPKASPGLRNAVAWNWLCLGGLLLTLAGYAASAVGAPWPGVAAASCLPPC